MGGTLINRRPDRRWVKLGTWAIVDHIARKAGGETIPGRDDILIFAPSLRALPQGAPMVMATLPVVDWNAELVDALKAMERIEGRRCYAAVMMIDPFLLWEDLVDLLRERGFSGVVNFPPASLAEGSLAAGGPEEENTIEIDRLKWFFDAGLNVAYAAASTDEIDRVDSRLAGLLDGILYLPPAALEKAIDHRLALEAYPAQRESIWTVRPA